VHEGSGTNIGSCGHTVRGGSPVCMAWLQRASEAIVGGEKGRKLMPSLGIQQGRPKASFIATRATINPNLVANTERSPTHTKCNNVARAVITLRYILSYCIALKREKPLHSFTRAVCLCRRPPYCEDIHSFPKGRSHHRQFGFRLKCRAAFTNAGIAY